MIGGLGGPGAMNATVEAVALLATTGSLMTASILLMLRRERTVQIPWNSDPQSTILNNKTLVDAKEWGMNELLDM